MEQFVLHRLTAMTSFTMSATFPVSSAVMSFTLNTSSILNTHIRLYINFITFCNICFKRWTRADTLIAANTLSICKYHFLTYYILSFCLSFLSSIPIQHNLLCGHSSLFFEHIKIIIVYSTDYTPLCMTKCGTKYKKTNGIIVFPFVFYFSTISFSSTILPVLSLPNCIASYILPENDSVHLESHHLFHKHINHSRTHLHLQNNY